MTLRLLLFVLLGWLALPSQAARPVTYTRADSLRVVELLDSARGLDSTACLPLHFARSLMGLPYVGGTLEVNPTEHLVVNLRQLDCTTLVETVTALVRTARSASPDFDEFCRQLAGLRYEGGEIRGYASRHHYFSQWIADNERRGRVEEVRGDSARGCAPFVARKTLDLSFMSTHPDLYPMLKGNKVRQAEIRRREEALSGTPARYIPKHTLGQEGLKKYVQDGDILALVTNKKGLDVAHVGLAVWGADGRLHLLHASSAKKQVILDPLSLEAYLKKHPAHLGVRVVRIK